MERGLYFTIDLCGLSESKEKKNVFEYRKSSSCSTNVSRDNDIENVVVGQAVTSPFCMIGQL